MSIFDDAVEEDLVVFLYLDSRGTPLWKLVEPEDLPVYKKRYDTWATVDALMLSDYS